MVVQQDIIDRKSIVRTTASSKVAKRRPSALEPPHVNALVHAVPSVQYDSHVSPSKSQPESSIRIASWTNCYCVHENLKTYSHCFPLEFNGQESTD